MVSRGIPEGVIVMNPVSAFLLASGMAYICCLVLPKPITNTGSIALEKTGLGAAGGIILLNLLFFEKKMVWIGLGALYVLGCILSYFGYVKWVVQWSRDTSDTAQMIMALWDLLIALCCLLKVI